MGFLNVLQWLAFLLAPLCLAALYILWNDRKLTAIPPNALYFSPKRCTVEDVHETAERMAKSRPVEEIPPKTGRRYIIVGGCGFLGGWIATRLLQRGEEKTRIRLLDISPPTNHTLLKEAITQGLEFIKVDVTDIEALKAAFMAPWHDQGDSELTVFHTAANIRFYERDLTFLSRSARVNVQGTQNVLAACLAARASVLVYTSSGSVAIHRTRYLLWPWEKEPARFIQIVNDDDKLLPKSHDEFFSNYAVTKFEGERLVRAADKTPLPSSSSQLRTGCIRPGNGIFGPRGDMLCGAYLVRKVNPTWISTVVQSFTYVENAATAHLLYEQRLIESISGAYPYPDLGGQTFSIADPGPTPTYGDVYATLEELSNGECRFPSLPPTMMLLMAYGVEAYYRLQNRFSSYLPRLSATLQNLQPPLFFLTSLHLIIDDSRARLPPQKGGLGYSGAWTTMEGLHRTWEEHASGVGRSEERAGTAGIGFGDWTGWRKKKSRPSVAHKVTDSIVDSDVVGAVPVEVLTPTAGH